MSNDIDARVFLLLMAARKVGNYLYAWGGESADEGGFDCSGFVSISLMETARAWPQLYDGGRQTAAGLYHYYHGKNCPDITRTQDLKPACLLFYRNPSGSIFHVAIHAADVPALTEKDEQSGKVRSVEVGPIAFEAGGAGSTATSPREALKRNAGIRVSASDAHTVNNTWVAKDPFILLVRGAER